MNRAHLLWLLALVLALVFVALEPMLSFALFGSDTGEYYRLTASLVTSGHVPLTNYAGWGSAYQDFPGIFLVSAATSQALGVDPLSALMVTVPVLAVVSVVPLYLLFRRLFAHEEVALLGAGLASFAMPRLFSIAHPAPLALGDLFVVAGLWMFLEGRRDVRWYLPLALTSAALIVTHHLSSYFFLLSALGGLLLLELVLPGRWSRRFPTRELAFSAAFGLGVVAYWLGYASAFRPIIDSGLGAYAFLAPVVAVPGVIAAVVVVGALIRWRRARGPRPSRPRLPSDRSVVRDFAILLGGSLLGIVALLLSPLPGGAAATSLAAVAFFAPLFLVIALATGSRRLLAFERTGPFALTWLALVGISAIVGWVSQSAVILPTRHAEYLLLPLGLLAAVSVGRLIARLRDTRGRRAVAAGVIGAVVLLAANAAIVYPPPQYFGGFQEGLTTADAAVWLWVGVGLPPTAVVASDHRLSSMIFGFDGNPATWDSTPALFVGTDRAAAFDELNGSYAPHAVRSIDAVAVDSVMRSGVALDPGGAAFPMSSAALAWLSSAPFVPLYENGEQVVYWVDGPVGSTG